MRDPNNFGASNSDVSFRSKKCLRCGDTDQHLFSLTYKYSQSACRISSRFSSSSCPLSFLSPVAHFLSFFVSLFLHSFALGRLCLLSPHIFYLSLPPFSNLNFLLRQRCTSRTPSLPPSLWLSSPTLVLSTGVPHSLSKTARMLRP